MGKITLADVSQNLSLEESDNMPGIKAQVLYFDWDDVKTWPTMPANAGGDVALAAAGVWVGDVVFNTGKKAYKLDFTEDTGEFSIKTAGETGGEFCEYERKLIQARIRKESMGLFNALKGKKLGFIVTDANGETYLMADANRSATLKPGEGFKTGKSGSNERNQSSLDFIYRCPRALMYEGKVAELLTAAP